MILPIAQSMMMSGGGGGSTPLILDTYPAPIAYSLEYISTAFIGNPVVTAKRDNDNSASSFKPSQISSADNTAGNLLNFTPDAFTGSGCKFTDLSRILFTANDSVDLRVTGDLTIIGHLKLDTYTNSAQGILTKYGLAGNRGYQVRINGGGRLAFLWSDDGTNQLSINSAVMPVSGGDEVYFKIDFDVDNGAGGKTITFSLSSDGGQTFTQFDQTVEAGTTQIFPTTAILELMETSRSAGEVYRLAIKDGIDGVDVFDADFTSRPALSGQFTENTGKVVTPNFTRCVLTDSHNQGTLGASADATQATAAAQPTIYDSVHGLVRGANGKPAIKFDGVDDYLTAGTGYTGSAVSAFSVSSNNVTIDGSSSQYGVYALASSVNNRWMLVYGGFGAGNRAQCFGADSTGSSGWEGTQSAWQTDIPAGTYSLMSAVVNSAGTEFAYNGASQGVDDKAFDFGNITSSAELRLGQRYGNNFTSNLDGNIQEVVFYFSDQTANRSAIEANINNRYTIY